ncbi:MULTISPECIES: hypothetical protein [unclassified Rhizobium]|uniref:hypothetical protein n=1 Tax=unclassified Rhizobium TaxID=2613769 RepID=UPI00247A14B0|nr:MULTISPECIES: hypothetical protein [unclassified Rhizobium]MDH7801697.1 hypothetical protein [Rhizobium sp. AN70]
MIIKAIDAQVYYRLLKNILRDIRDAHFSMFQPEEKYRNLYQNIRVIHLDYIGLFGDFLENIKREKDQNKIAKSKIKFKMARRRQGNFRLLSKVEAHSYLSNITDIWTLRFLTTVIWYLSYSATPNVPRLHTLEALDLEIVLALQDDLIGDRAWDSSSDAFWAEIEDLEDAESLTEITKYMLDSITERYALLEMTFGEMSSGNALQKKRITLTKHTSHMQREIDRRKTRYYSEIA